MNKLFKIHWLAALCGLTMLSLTACNDDDNPENKSPEVNPDINVIGYNLQQFRFCL